MALTLPSLFVYVEVKDYVPDTWADLTHALSNPTKYFNVNEKKSIKMKDGSTASDDKFSLNQSNGRTGSSKGSNALVQNGPSGSNTKGAQDPIKETEEPQTANQDELQRHKSFIKLQKKQEKELKEMERKGMKRREEILQKYSSAFSTLYGQNNKKKCCGSKDLKKKRSVPEDDYGAVWGAGEIPGKGDPKVLEMKEKLEQELIRAGEELYESIWKKKEQHCTEQIAKLMELAQERQTAEVKVLKETAYSDTKQMKKKLEMKRMERLETMNNNTMDKAAQERLKKEINNSHIQEVVQVLQMVSDKWNNHQQKLEEKQAEGIQRMKEKGEQTQKELQEEYQEKLNKISDEVPELVYNCMVAFFPTEAKIEKKEAKNCSSNKWEFLLAKTDNGDSMAKNSQSGSVESNMKSQTDDDTTATKPGYDAILGDSALASATDSVQTTTTTNDASQDDVIPFVPSAETKDGPSQE